MVKWCMSDRPAEESNSGVWLLRARSCLALARLGHGADDVVLEDLCFHTQQCVEKAMKGVLISAGAGFPKGHTISELITRIHHIGINVPAELSGAAELTVYAVQTRYPGPPAVNEDDYLEALAMAADVLSWAEGIVFGDPQASKPQVP